MRPAGPSSPRIPSPRRSSGDGERDDPGPRAEGDGAAAGRGAAPRPGADGGPGGRADARPGAGGGLADGAAQLNGKNYRKLLKQVAEHGEGNVSVVLQGFLKPPTAPGEPFVLESAGFQVNVKAPRPAEAEPSGEEPPPG